MEINYENSKDDFPSMTFDLMKKINWKIALFIFAASIFIFSDVFTDSVLVLSKNSMDGNCPNTKGTIIQIAFLVVFYIIIDILVQSDII